MLKNWQKDIFDKAFESIEFLKGTDFEMYSKYFDRIMQEDLAIKYLLISLYKTEFTTNQIVNMIDEFEYYSSLYNFNYYKENGYTKDLIELWRSSL